MYRLCICWFWWLQYVLACFQMFSAPPAPSPSSWLWPLPMPVEVCVFLSLWALRTLENICLCFCFNPWALEVQFSLWVFAGQMNRINFSLGLINGRCLSISSQEESATFIQVPRQSHFCACSLVMRVCVQVSGSPVDVQGLVAGILDIWF